MTTDEPMFGMIRRCYCTPHPCSCEHPDGNEYPDPLGVSPLEYARAQARRAADERTLARLRGALYIPHATDPAGPTAAELAAGVPLDAFVDDLALASDTTPDAVLDAVRPILTGRATYRGTFVVEPLVAVAFRLRIRGLPYIAEAPIAGSPPGYRLHPDRRQRWQDRLDGGPRRTPPPVRFLPRPVDAPGCHPAFRLLNLLGGTW